MQFEVMSPTALTETAADLQVIPTHDSGGLSLLSFRRWNVHAAATAGKAVVPTKSWQLAHIVDKSPTHAKPVNTNMSTSLCAKIIRNILNVVVVFHAHWFSWLSDLNGSKDIESEGLRQLKEGLLWWKRKELWFAWQTRCIWNSQDFHLRNFRCSKHGIFLWHEKLKAWKCCGIIEKFFLDSVHTKLENDMQPSIFWVWERSSHKKPRNKEVTKLVF